MNFWLNYHHLYYFKVIATEGSIARASEKLLLGQPTLSAQLKQLEESLEVKLFDRKYRKLVITDAGKMVLEYANEIFKIGKELVDVVHDRKAPDRLKIQLGALDSIPKTLTLDIVKNAVKNFKCNISIVEGDGDKLLRNLLSSKIDMMISNYPPTITRPNELFVKSISRHPVVVCGHKKYKKFKKNFPESLNMAPFILPNYDSRMRYDLDHFFTLKNIQVDCIAETQDTSLQNLMCLSGMGLIPVTSLMVDKLIRTNTDLMVLGELEGVFEEFYLSTTSKKIPNPIADFIFKKYRA